MLMLMNMLTSTHDHAEFVSSICSWLPCSPWQDL